MNVSLTEDEKRPGQLLAHRPDCLVVMQHRVQGRPIMTMLDCEKPLPGDLKKCVCLG